MTKRNIGSGIGLILGAVAAVALLGWSLPAAVAQGRNHTQNSGAGYHQDQTGQHGHQWVESTPSGGRVYHNQPRFVSHPYQGSEHRRYYTYQGSEFYLNLDTGIRIAL